MCLIDATEEHFHKQADLRADKGAAPGTCFKLEREIHNNASELPAVCHSCHLSFGYSHSHSMVSWAQQLIPQEKADLC